MENKYTFTMEELITTLKAQIKENGRYWISSTEAIRYVALITGKTYDEIYNLTR